MGRFASRCLPQRLRRFRKRRMRMLRTRAANLRSRSLFKVKPSPTPRDRVAQMPNESLRTKPSTKVSPGSKGGKRRKQGVKGRFHHRTSQRSASRRHGLPECWSPASRGPHASPEHRFALLRLGAILHPGHRRGQWPGERPHTPCPPTRPAPGVGRACVTIGRRKWMQVAKSCDGLRTVKT